MLKRTLSRILLTSIVFLIVVFIISLFGLYPTNVEIPLTNIQGVIVKGNKIYLGIGQPSNRIQSYNLKGEFIENTKVDGGRRQFTFTVDSNGDIITTQHSIIERNLMVDIYTNNPIPSFSDYHKTFQLTNPNNYIDEKKDLYKFNSSLLSNTLTVGKYGFDLPIIQQGFLFKLFHLGYAHFIDFFLILIFTVINSNILSELVKSKQFSIWKFLLVSIK